MLFDFNFYIIHSSAVILKNQVELFEVINEILIADSSATILIEHQDNFIGNNLIKKSYFRFLFNMEKLANFFPKRIIIISGQSSWQSARKLILEEKSICFINFPYPELRSLSLQIKNSNIGKYAILDFLDNSKIEILDLTQNNDKMSYQNLEKIFYKPLYTIEELTGFKNIKQFGQTLSSKLYVYEENGKKMIMKSLVREFKPDYFMKVNDLIKIRKLFQKAGILESLPQKIVVTNNEKRAIVCNYIEGSSFEKLCYDNFYKKFMTNNSYKTNIVNRICLIIRLCTTIMMYHSVGIYLSDIKGDNFIITNDCNVVPIDSDGFCYYKYYSSCPKKDMIQNAKLNRKRAFLQNAHFELYAVFVMIYRFLMDGNFPFDCEDESYSIDNIQKKSDNLYSTERGRVLIGRWFSFPQYIREVLYGGLYENERYPIEILLKRFIKYYFELIRDDTGYRIISEDIKAEYFIGMKENIGIDIMSFIVLQKE